MIKHYKLYIIGGDFVKTAWNLSLELLSILKEIDDLLEQKSKENNINKQNILDKRIDVLETKMFEIKNILKNMEV